MDRLSDCIQAVHLRWLASSFSCCFPRLPDQSEPDIPALDQYREICYEQPRPVSSPQVGSLTARPASRSAHRPSQWLAEGRMLASRASSRASFTKRAVIRRPTIGAPLDFRKVELPRPQTEEFRPLELSIYLPGNELPSLPIFSHDDTEGEIRIICPAPVLTKARSESLLSRPSASFSIPRKPINSRALSFDGSRSSFETRLRTSDLSHGWGPPALHQRPSIATTQSTLDFLDTLDSRLPQLPSRSTSKSGPEPVYTLYRRASEQSLRLRTHLEERERIEKRLPDCDTILEEKQGVERQFPNLSPISSCGDATEQFPPPEPTFETPDPSSLPTHPHLLSNLDELQTSKSPTGPDQPFTLSRISQWLLRSTSAHSPPSITSSSEEIYARRASTTRDRASTVSTACSNAETVDPTSPWSSPRTYPHRKGSSVSSWQTSIYCRRLSMDAETRPAMPIVGVAF